jgi:signal transduction histidine kinase
MEREQIVGRNAREFLPPGRGSLYETAAEILADNGVLENLELPLLRSDGSDALTIVKARVRRNERDEISEIRVVLRDITRRKSLQRRLELAERLATTGRLAASVAHEINNPLQALLTHLELVDDALPDAFDERDSWRRVQEGVGRIRGVVNDLLDLHRVGQSHHESVDLNEVIREAVGLTENQLRVSGIEARVRLDESLPRVTGTQQRLYQVILNLMLNGAESMERGGVLTVASRSATSQVIVEVADTGPGIPSENLPHIFDPFLTSGKVQGTGLGLFVSYNLIKDHHGDIEVESRPGEGTTFRVRLPAEEEGAPEGRAMGWSGPAT